MDIPLLLTVVTVLAVSVVVLVVGLALVVRQAGLGRGSASIAESQRQAALDVREDGRMQLPALHFFKRTYPRVGVVQAEHISQADHIVFEVVKKSSAKTVVRRRPARSVQHQARLRLFGGYFP